jgi:hypothetical protein
MKVELYSLGPNGDDKKVGTITLENGEFTADTDTAKRVLQKPVFTNRGDLTSQRDPELFMRWLPYHYKSYALRATEPK